VHDTSLLGAGCQGRLHSLPCDATQGDFDNRSDGWVLLRQGTCCPMGWLYTVLLHRT